MRKNTRRNIRRQIKRAVTATTAMAFVTVSATSPLINVPFITYAQENIAVQSSVVVTNENELRQALNAGNKDITINGSITIAEATDSTPFMIPEGVTLTGSNSNSGLTLRGALQLAGDNVTFKDMQLHFISTNALGSVIHREIFLAGHSLTLDNVDTFVEGGAGSGLGGFGGTEKELLPTIYAGGYKNTIVGQNAELTILNAIDNTKIQDIYMSHEQDDEKTSYNGNVKMTFDAKTTVVDTIYTENNTKADIFVKGMANGVASCKIQNIYGNENTTLTLQKCSADMTIDNVENIILDNEADLSLLSGAIKNIELKNNSTLNITKYSDSDFVEITGDFIGSNSTDESNLQENTYLVTDNTKQLIIDGDILGKTDVVIGNKQFPKEFEEGYTYITASGTSNKDNFVAGKTGWDLKYSTKDNAEASWEAVKETGTQPEPEEMTVSRVEIKSAPKKVYLKSIIQPDDYESQTPDITLSFYINCYDNKGNIIEYDDIADDIIDNVIVIKTDYWESKDESDLQEKNWGAPIRLETQENYENRYFLVANNQAVAGKYTFLFIPNGYENELKTVSDIKDLKDSILAEWTIEFTDTEIVDEKMETPNVSIDYSNEILTGFDTTGKYTINGKNVSVSQDGTVELDTAYFGQTLNIVRKAVEEHYIDSDVQSIVIPNRIQAPQVEGTDASSTGEDDGVINGVSTAMEYKMVSENNWHDCTSDTIENLAPAVYQVRLKADNNNFASDITTVTISREEVKTFHVVIENGTGTNEYKVGDKVTIVAKEALEGMAFDKWVSNVEFEYTDDTNASSSTAVFIMPESDIELTATYKDISAPTGQITISTNKWNDFCNKITFGIFFKETQKINITAQDIGLGIDKIYYYISEEPKSIEDIKNLKDTEWTEYKEEFSINPDKSCVVYAKITDKGGNEKYLSSDGLVFDATSPAITGVKNNEIYKESVEITVIDDNLDYVEIDGKIVGHENGSYKVDYVAGSHIIKAVDKAGNMTQLTINMVKEEPTTQPTQETTKETETTTKEPETTTKQTETTTKETESTTKQTESTTKQTESTTKETESTTKQTETTTKQTETTTKATQSTTKATQPTTKATESTTKATQSTTKATESTTKQTEQTTKQTESTTKQTESTTKQTESTTKQTESTTKQTESTTKQTESTTKATESTTKATEPTTKATESTTKATEPTTKATQPTTKATESTTKATQPTTKATESTTKATQQTTKATESTTKATQPTTKATESTTKATQPTTKATESTTKATQPTTKATESTTKATQPTTKATESTTKATEPITETTVEPTQAEKLEISDDGNWYYTVDGVTDYNYNGLAENEYGWWKVANGEIDFSYNGLADNKYGWWKITNGTVDFNANGLILDEATDTWWYFNEGAIDFNYTGLALNEHGWWKVSNGKVDLSFNGLELNEYGWWKVSNGIIDLSYNGISSNEYGTWKVTNGTVDLTANGLIFDSETDKWWYFNGGAIDFNYTGLALNEYDWWKITNGTVDLSYTGLALNEYGWWKVTNGVIDLSYNGIAPNEYGTWKVTNGTVDFTANGLIFDSETDKWWYFNGGAIDFSYTGLALNEYNWWKISNGTIDFNYSGLADNQYGTWNVVNGQVVLE